MVVSAPTYHLVSNIVPPDAGGPLQIGTIINSLQELTPLNEGEEIKIPKARLYCFHETNFESTRNQASKGSGGVGVKLMAWHVPVGGDVSGEGETSADDTFNATSLDTLFFSPTKEDYVQAVKSAQLQEYLKPAEYPSVYIITGMKIAREPSITLKRGKKIAAQGQLGMDLGNGGTIGPRGDGSKTSNTMQKSDKSTDIVLAIRVRKLSYKKKYYIFGDRQWSENAHDGGAELVGRDRAEEASDPGPEFEVDELELEDELQGHVKENEKEADGETTTWVVPEALHSY